jgi:hypothetical protein
MYVLVERRVSFSGYKRLGNFQGGPLFIKSIAKLIKIRPASDCKEVKILNRS